MTRLALLTAVLVAAAAAFAEDTDGFAHWTPAQLQETEKALVATQKDPASQSLGKYGNHTAALSHRESDGKAEVHERKHDFFVVQSGEATLVTGGTVVDDEAGKGGEHTGTAIKGGKETVLHGGDVVHIPAGMPHQLRIKNGGSFTYFVIKVEAAAAP